MGFNLCMTSHWLSDDSVTWCSFFMRTTCGSDCRVKRKNGVILSVSRFNHTKFPVQLYQSRCAHSHFMKLGKMMARKNTFTPYVRRPYAVDDDNNHFNSENVPQTIYDVRNTYRVCDPLRATTASCMQYLHIPWGTSDEEYFVYSENDFHRFSRILARVFCTRIPKLASSSVLSLHMIWRVMAF